MNDQPGRDQTEDRTQPEAATPQRPAEAPLSAGFLFCTRCGGAMSDAEFCPRCSARRCVTCGDA